MFEPHQGCANFHLIKCGLFQGYSCVAFTGYIYIYMYIYIYVHIYIWCIALKIGYVDTINEIQNGQKRDK